MEERGKSRVFNLIMAIIYAIILLLLIIALGAFAKKSQEFLSDIPDVDVNIEVNYCPLYVRSDGTGTRLVIFPPATPCNFVIGVEACLAIAVTGLLIFAVIKIVIAPKVLSLLALVDLIVSFACAVGAFAVSIALTAGLNQTCGAIADANDRPIDCRVSFLQIIFGLTPERTFYEPINAAQGVSWVSVFLLIAVVVTYVIVLILFGIKRKKPRQTSTTKTSSEKMENVANT